MQPIYVLSLAISGSAAIERLAFFRAQIELALSG